MKLLANALLISAVMFVCTFSATGTTNSTAATATSKIEPVTAINAESEEVYTGTIVNTNGRMATSGFTLRLKGFTSDDDFGHYLGILAEGDQFDVLKAIKNVDLGTFTPTRDVGRQISVARKTTLPDGRTRIVVAFERWLKFAEVRNGYRSEDYPFAILEVIFDTNGKGAGTYIAACAVDLERDKKSGQFKLELENFGTYPSKVMGVSRRDK
jgi:hypothetical protein